MAYPTRETLAQALRFALVGVTVACVYVIGYLVLRRIGIPPAPAATVAYGIAIVLQYLGHSGFTFRRRVRDGGQIRRFVILNGIGLVTAVVLTLVLTNGFNTPDWVASAAVVVVLPVLNWFLMRLWVFA